MAAIKVKKLWTVFITAFFAVLASLGLTSPATAVGSAVSAQPAEQPAPAPAPAVAVHPHRVAEPAPTRAVLPVAPPRGRALPPTIKQRITAEAHGSSPSVRHLPAVLPAASPAVLPTGSGSGSGSGTGMGADADAGVGAVSDRARGNAYAADAALVTA